MSIILLEKSNLGASEKFGFEMRQNNNNSCTFDFSAFHENSVVCAKNKQVQFEDPSTDRKLSINTLTKLMEKCEIDYRITSKLISFPTFWDCQGPT